jgi:hypothetical protein
MSEHPPITDQEVSQPRHERRPLTLAELRLLADACVEEWPMLLRFYSDRQILDAWRRLADDHNLMVEGQRRQGR